MTNFFNPSAIYLGGLLSTVEPFVAAVRSEVYQGSHPLATQHLRIVASRTKERAGVLGASAMAADLVLSAPAVDALLS